MRTLNESIERCGEVIGIARGVAQIRLEANAGCAGCGSRHTCASGDAAPLMIELAVPGKVQAGARVTIAMPAASLTLAALLGYLLPPVALLIGAIVANLAFGSDLAAVLGAVLGLFAGIFAARLTAALAFGRMLSPVIRDPEFQPGEHP